MVYTIFSGVEVQFDFFLPRLQWDMCYGALPWYVLMASSQFMLDHCHYLEQVFPNWVTRNTFAR